MPSTSRSTRTESSRSDADGHLFDEPASARGEGSPALEVEVGPLAELDATPDDSLSLQLVAAQGLLAFGGSARDD